MAKQRRASENEGFQFPGNYLNFIVGIIVVIVLAVIVVGFIRSRGAQTPTDQQTQQEPTTVPSVSLPTKYTVVEGDDLWKISDKFYKTGYNWSDIAKANNITDPNTIGA